MSLDGSLAQAELRGGSGVCTGGDIGAQHIDLPTRRRQRSPGTARAGHSQL
jgi:hypothetical protein